jgi:polyketide biosynthesis enoyl-CoA hydratase PksH
MDYQTIKVRFQDSICFIQIHRPEANNTINDQLIEEFHHVLALCEESITVVVVEGLPEVFCFGADFNEIHKQMTCGDVSREGPEPLYNLWLKMATGPYVTISHVRGKVNAGGMGFVAASDIVLADQTVQFSLSELLFGLLPAFILPFLIRRIGFQKANYLSLMTKPISVQEAHTWGVVDVYDVHSESLLRKHLLRLKCLSKTGIQRYKRYINGLNDFLLQSKSLALATHIEAFSNQQNLEGICHYVETGQFPWEKRQ